MKVVDPFSNVADSPVQGTMYGSELNNIDTLQAGTGDKVMRADSQGLWLGASEFVDAPFRVDMDGNVVMSSGAITGYVTVGGSASDVNSGAVTISGGKITAGSITASQIATGTITANEIAGSTITASKIASGTITATQIAGSTITGSKIASGTITASNISANTITASEIASSVISGGKIVASLLTADNITTGSLTGLTVQTASSGSRVVMNGADNKIQFYYSSSLVGQFYGLSNGLAITGGDANLIRIIDPIKIEAAMEMVASIDMNSYDITEIDELKGGDGYLDMNSGNGNTQAKHFDPNTNNTYNLGGSSRYWAYLNCHDVSYHSLGFYDDGVTVEIDGKKTRVSDVQAIKMMKPHQTKKTKDGAPLLDKQSLPLEMFIPAQNHKGESFPRDPETGLPIVSGYEPVLDDSGEQVYYKNGKRKIQKITQVMEDADGESGAQLLALALGAIRELDGRIEALEKKE